MYLVLSSRPNTAPTGQTSKGYENGRSFFIQWESVTDWPILGTAKNYEEARARFGGRPVLAEIEEPPKPVWPRREGSREAVRA